MSRQLTAGLVLATTLSLAVPLSMFADNAVSDGDGVTPVTNHDMSAGSVDCGVAKDNTALVAVTRNGAAGSTNVFKDGSTVTMSVLSTSGDVSASFPGPATITLPAIWGTVANNTLSTSVSATVTVNSSTEGAGSGSVTFRATGVNASNATITRDDSMNVSWTTGSCTPPDTTAPDIQYVINPSSPDGDNGWYKGDVTLTWTVTENESASSLQKTGCVDQNIIADQQETTYSCSATSDGGSAGPVDVKIKRDGTAPVITDLGPASAPDGDNGWYVSAVTNDFSATDATSGLASGYSSPFSRSSGTSEGSAVEIASGTVKDAAGNTAMSIDSAAFMIDLSDPTGINFVGGPADGGSYYFGSVPAAPTCTATDAVSGFASCVVSGYSAATGPHTMTATATDIAGRTATATRSYTVLAWTLTGFYQPVDMNGVWNTVKAGSTIPFKFNVHAGSTELTNVSAVQGFTATGVACPATGYTADAIEVTATGGTSLRYDSTAGQFIYNWQTPKKAGSCYAVTMTTQDGSTLSANFILK